MAKAKAKIKRGGSIKKKPKKRTYEQREHMKTKGYLLATEVARLLKVHHSAVYRMLDSEQLTELKIGAARYVSVASVKKYLGPAAKAFNL